MQNDTRIAVDIAKECLRDRGVGSARACRAPGEAAARPVPRVLRQLPRRHRGHGGLRLGSLLGAPDRGAWPPGGPASSSVRPSLRARNKTDRTDVKGILEACRNDRHPARPHQDRGPTGHRPRCTVCARAGWPSAPRASTLCGACCASWASSSRWAHAGAARGVGAHRGRRLGPARRARADLRRGLPGDPRTRRASRRSSASSRRWPSRSPSSATCAPSPASACSPPPPCSPSSATSIAFPSGRHLASFLGLTPREYSSGLKRHLGRISKRGDGYLRTLLIHGARSVLCTPA